MSVLHCNESNFNDIIQGDLVLVDFFATWCGPCKMLAPVLEEFASDRGVSVAKVDIDESRELAKQFGVMSVPTLILFQGGKLVAQHTGFMPKELLSQWVEDHR